jgi:hypothetical protein
MKLWKVLGVAGLAGVAATGVIIAREQRQRAQLTPDEIRLRLNLAMLFITHDLRVAARVCDRVAVMQRGRIVEQGPVAQVFGSPRHEYTKALFAAIPGKRWVKTTLPSLFSTRSLASWIILFVFPLPLRPTNNLTILIAPLNFN